MSFFYVKQDKTNHIGEVVGTIDVVSIKRIIIAVAMAIIMLIFLWGSWFTVAEGHVGITTRFSKATGQVGTGLHFKWPIVEGVKKIEVRERKSVEELNAATNNQLPITARVSVNWTVDSSAALRLYSDYGSLDQFEDRILDPKLRQAAKAALSSFNADQLIRNRNAAIVKIQGFLIELMKGYPVTVHSPQIENIGYPETYLQAVMEKEQARESASKEQYNLEKQKLTAAQLVQTAEAERDSLIAAADGLAYKIETEAKAHAEATRLKGIAEASAIDVVQKALANNPLLVQYEQAKRWNGQLPTSMIPGGTIPFITVK